MYQFNSWQVFVAENDVHYMRTTECVLDSTAIGQPSRVRSLTRCASVCNKHLTCEVFGYASITQLCRLAGALLAPSDLNSGCATNETVFKSGKIVRLAKLNQYDMLLLCLFSESDCKL